MGHHPDNPLSTASYCTYVPLILANNPGIISLKYDPNPNPLTNDCSTDHAELQILASRWIESGCNEDNNWCGGTDMDHVDDVNLKDFAVFARLWLQSP